MVISSDYNTYLISYCLSQAHIIMWQYFIVLFCFRPYHNALVLYRNYHCLIILVHLSIIFDFPTVKPTMVAVYPGLLNYQLNTSLSVTTMMTETTKIIIIHLMTNLQRYLFHARRAIRVLYKVIQ